jgi:CheY-like chemotaxis protein
MPAPLYVLIAAHNRDVKTILTRLLIRTYPTASLDIADNGAEALAMITHRRPDLLITDNRMPIMDGLMLVRALRVQLAAFPMLLLSSRVELEPQALAAGATHFLLKPFSSTVLREALDALLPHAGRDRSV